MTDKSALNSPECPSCNAAESVPAKMILFPKVEQAFGAFCFHCHAFYTLPEGWEWAEWSRNWNRSAHDRD